MAIVRSWLFVPANRADRIRKAFDIGVDRVIVDLEDACPEADKLTARTALPSLLDGLPVDRCFIRVNPVESEHALADLEAAVAASVAGVILPKAQRAADLHAVAWALTQFERRAGRSGGGIELMPLIESALGLVDLEAIVRASPPRVRRLAFGAGDLSIDLGFDLTDTEAELGAARAALVAVSRAFGLEPPIDTPWGAISDLDGCARSVATARAAGFAGKAIIHPSHVAIANAGFTPSAEAVTEARNILAAYAAAAADGRGAFQIDGRLIDFAHVVKARRTLAANGEVHDN